MKGLLVAATKFEVAPTIKYINKNSDWNVLITGVGGVATVYALTKELQKSRPDFLLQAGIGGSFNRQLGLGAVVSVGRDCLGDLGAIEDKRRKTIFDLGLTDRNQKPFKNGRLVNPGKKNLKLAALPVVDAVSVNEITTRRNDIIFFRDGLSAIVESMEGAAFHYVALMEKIPFLQVRAISNYVGERDKRKWKMKEAVTNLNIEVVNFIAQLKIYNIKNSFKGKKEAL